MHSSQWDQNPVFSKSKTVTIEYLKHSQAESSYSENGSMWIAALFPMAAFKRACHCFFQIDPCLTNMEGRQCLYAFVIKDQGYKNETQTALWSSYHYTFPTSLAPATQSSLIDLNIPHPSLLLITSSVVLNPHFKLQNVKPCQTAQNF